MPCAQCCIFARWTLIVASDPYDIVPNTTRPSSHTANFFKDNFNLCGLTLGLLLLSRVNPWFIHLLAPNFTSLTQPICMYILDGKPALTLLVQCVSQLELYEFVSKDSALFHFDVRIIDEVVLWTFSLKLKRGQNYWSEDSIYSFFIQLIPWLYIIN